ncbi:MAG: FtsQ-type POTRA domain-containing protein [Firmicutes bacterium]|nr:FtsQ-type POTRA domain-containing protein [Bacillota bacterium]
MTRVHRLRLFGLIAVFFFTGVVQASPLFRLERIEVTGSPVLGRDGVKAIADVSEGDNLLGISPSAMQRVLEEHWLIQSAKVERDLPRTLRIEITERRPVVLIRRENSYAAVDEEGYVIALGVGRGDPGLPAVIGLEGDLPGPGRQVPDLERFMRAGQVVSLAPESVKALIREIDVQNLEDIRLLVEESLQVRLGKAADLPRQLSYLEAIRLELAREGLARGIVMLTGEGNPSFRPWNDSGRGNDR